MTQENQICTTCGSIGHTYMNCPRLNFFDLFSAAMGVPNIASGESAQDLRNRVCKEITQLRTEQEQSATKPAPQSNPAAKEGWKLVPVEPTDAMLDAAQSAVDDAFRVDIVRMYSAMLAAAPQGSDK